MKEENHSYFQNALSEFAFDVACGSQIRHLANLGYTVNQIAAGLDISVPYESVQKTVNEHLRKEGILVCGRPDNGHAKTKFIKEYGRYGKPSFRQVVIAEPDTVSVKWQEHVYDSDADGGLLSFLDRKTAENGESCSYISCDFGLDRQGTEEALSALERRQQEYMQGILWERMRMYHRLTPNMRAIIARLYAQGFYEGECYFRKTGEYIRL